MVLEEKKAPYELIPATQETKPNWLVQNHEGSMPALQKGTACYTESDVICKHLDLTVAPESSLSSYTEDEMDLATRSTDGFFLVVAKYLKHTKDDDTNTALKGNIEWALRKLNFFLLGARRTGPYLVGDGKRITLMDCALAPQLYHLLVGLDAFKGNAVRLEDSYPAVKKYTDAVFARPSFETTKYSEEYIILGWKDERTKKKGTPGCGWKSRSK